MSKEPIKVKKVEELKNFPFKSFQEFKKTHLEGVAHPGVDRSVALQWAQNGIYAGTFLKLRTMFLLLLPYFAVIGFIIYIVLSKHWLLFLTLPVFIIAFLIFHPGSAMIFGLIRSGLIGLTIFGLIWSILTGKSFLFAFTLTLFIIWYSSKSIYNNAINHLIHAVTEHEDLLCILWQGKALNIRFYNGNSYWVDWKLEDGKHVHYE